MQSNFDFAQSQNVDPFAVSAFQKASSGWKILELALKKSVKGFKQALVCYNEDSFLIDDLL